MAALNGPKPVRRGAGMRCSARWMAVATLMVVLTAAPAYAYVDPGSASMFFQILIGTLLGAVVAVKVYWNKLKSLFRRDISQKNSDTV